MKIDLSVVKLGIKYVISNIYLIHCTVIELLMKISMKVI